MDRSYAYKLLPGESPSLNAPLVVSETFQIPRGDMHACIAIGDAILSAAALNGSESRLEFSVTTQQIAEALAAVGLTLIDAESEAPISGANVRIKNSTNTGRGISTGDDGVVLFAGEFPGPRRLEISKPGYETIATIVHLDPGQTVDCGRVMLSKARSITIKLVGTDWAGRGVWLECQSPSEVSGSEIGFAFPGQWFRDYELTVRDVGRREYIVKLLVDDLCYPMEISIEDIERGVVEVRYPQLVPMSITLGESVGMHANVMIVSERYGMMANIDLEEGGEQAITANVVPGEYVVKLMVDGEIVSTQRCVARDDLLNVKMVR